MDSGTRFLVVRRNSGYTFIVPEVISLGIDDNWDTVRFGVFHNIFDEPSSDHPFIVISEDNRVARWQLRNNSIQ